eukprot:5130980-Prymnesium_polylepis.1
MGWSAGNRGDLRGTGRRQPSAKACCGGRSLWHVRTLRRVLRPDRICWCVDSGARRVASPESQLLLRPQVDGGGGAIAVGAREGGDGVGRLVGRDLPPLSRSQRVRARAGATIPLNGRSVLVEEALR